MTFPSRWVLRHSWLIIVLGLLLCLPFVPQLWRLQVDSEIKNQLPRNMPILNDARQIERSFGGGEMVMVIVKADDPLAPNTLKRAQGLADAIAALPSVGQVLSPFSINDLHADARGLVVGPVLNVSEAAAVDGATLRSRLRQNPLVFGNVIARDFSALALMAKLKAEAREGEAIEQLRSAIAAHQGPEAIVLSGMPVVRQQVSADIRRDLQCLRPVAMLTMFALLFFALRELRGVLVPLTVQLMSIVIAIGLMPPLGWKLQIVSVTLPVILLALGNDHTGHLIATCQQLGSSLRHLSNAEVTRRALSR